MPVNPRSFQSDAAPASAPLPEQLLRVFHDQTRAPVPLGTAERPLELDGPVRKHYDLDPAGHFAMVESPDGLGDDPDGLVLRVRDFFAQRGQKVEWKTYDYDEPSDLGARLEAAGFVREDDEALILGEAGPLAAQDLALPEGVVVRAADGFEDFARMRTMSETVWGDDHAWVTESLYPEWVARPDSMDVVVVEESREGPVLCAARGEYDASGFTGLWGGSTLPEWRGRGLYRATLLHRARLGLDRGKEYVRVDASPDSEPILRRLGLHRVATTTPYVFDPRA
ncbi:MULTISPECIES: GNAT family N-acetyltransferase [unclassified Terrabacter]|uniref:GNAT family N-acetyltransferase n=1 Tax=unclassified Terrabacter TaxID=2630222 RepID=UPI0012E3310C|nr:MULTISPECIES: GNAT family N-acetyltransferase [unclassified Terrabacter]